MLKSIPGLLAVGAVLVLGGCSHSDTPADTAVGELVFRVEGLTCGAVEGIGCGQLLDPVLARLEQIPGVEQSSANWTGTMIKVSVRATADRDEAEGAAVKVLKEDNRDATCLAGDELRSALQQEKWFDAQRINELSAFEYRTLSTRFMRSFAEKENLDQELTDNLLKAIEEEWDRLDQRKRPADGTGWRKRCAEVAQATSDRIKGLLTTEQLDRFRKMVDERIGGGPRERGKE